MTADEAFEAFDRGDWTEAERLYRARLAEASGTDAEQSPMHMLAFTLAMKGEFEEAIGLYGELLRRAGEQDAAEDIAVAMHQLGMTCRLAGDSRKARAWFEQELEFRKDRLPDDQTGFSANSYEFGELDLLEGESEKALAHFRLALRQGKAAGDDICTGCAWRGIGKASRVMHHDPTTAWELALDAFRRAGDKAGEAEIRRMIGK
ncbi:tetratricopeptide repeat protein [Bhargavaea ullalensis]|uniref:Tetratricopeptide (TPR) repeat protein n=1 Tax=Bhargavaea ullalensis TaxID=1265685 RepID=A0ABV2G8D0_9BACL